MWDDLRSAISFLTILPFGFPDGRKAGWSFAWYPLVGLLIGGLLIIVAHLSPFDSLLTSALILLAWIIITGGLHLDGFSDSCDGLLATVKPDRRLEIMKDPRTGSWAVIGLIILLLVKWLAIGTVPIDLLIIPPLLGRWAMVLAVYSFPYARQSGLGGYFRDGLDTPQVLMATTIAFVVCTHFDTTMLMISVFCFVWLFGKWASKRLGGGITGDVYGAICELTEVLCLLVIGASYG